MVKFLSQYAKWIIAGFGFLVFGLSQTSWLTNSELWQKAEGALIDRRYLLRAANPANPDIKLVGIQNSTISLDELAPEEIAASPTLKLMQHPWPWDRSVYAAVLEKLMDAGAKVVVFDFVFAAQTDGDEIFAKALQKYKDNVVIGGQFSPEESNQENDQKYTPPNPDLLLPGTEDIVGVVNLWADVDGVQRRGIYRTSIERETLRLPYLDPKTVKQLKKMMSDGEAPDNLIHLSALAVQKFASLVNTPPYDHDNFINFQGAAGTYDVIPLEKLFVKSLWQSPPVNAGIIFSNKIVIVGPIAEIFHDTHYTPFGDMPGPEIQAQMMATLLRNGSLHEPSLVWSRALTVFMVMIALAICLWVGQALLKSLLLLGATFAFLIAWQIAFSKGNLVISMMQPLVCLMVPASFGIVFQYALEQFERIRTRGLLERYVSKNVAKTVLEDKRSFEESLRGQKKPVTVLFSDIRGFTSMTESTDADKLVAQLNEYFGEMVKIIEEKNSGTLQKFIGDAIMAAWGDVYSYGLEVDSKRAVSAALEMRAALVKLNSGWKNNPDRRILATGIGVNHGEVIYGNIGSHKRMELTVLGDGVNLAARLESATKQFHTDILIGEETEKLTRENFIYRSVGAIAFKGKTKPIEVFTLLGDRSQPAPAWLAKYHEAIKLFRGRQFAEAAIRFEASRREIGGGDFLCEIYIERCTACIERPPPADWDGSYALAEK